MTLWPWALQTYGRADVAQACLDLQDDHRQSVPYLLWAAWAAQDGRPLSPDILGRGALLAGHWEQIAVSPLRQARRGMKPPLDGIGDAAREALRAQVKALELKAEQTLMAALEDMAPAAASAAAPLEPALVAAAEAWMFPAPRSALRRLANALG
ncbi:MAG: hypothetical protein JWO72_1603 [Caulobacteraceae bacterium]|nr:hypothetical protein [Caulobacteraceae bacterium]